MPWVWRTATWQEPLAEEALLKCTCDVGLAAWLHPGKMLFVQERQRRASWGLSIALEKGLDTTWYKDAIYLDILIVFKWKTKKGLNVRGYPVLEEFGLGAFGSLAASALSVGMGPFFVWCIIVLAVMNEGKCQIGRQRMRRENHLSDDKIIAQGAQRVVVLSCSYLAVISKPRNKKC